MATLEPLLAAHPFFTDLEPRCLQVVAGCVANRRFPAGAFLGREGEAANQFYLLRHGKVALQIHVPDQGPLTIERLSGNKTFIIEDFRSYAGQG
jgi:hypothetical protein